MLVVARRHSDQTKAVTSTFIAITTSTSVPDPSRPRHRAHKRVTEVDCAHVSDRVPEDTASVAFARVLDRY